MKYDNIILTLQETEELCRLYLECKLSLLEETELQYVLSKMTYSSDVINEARESMIAEGLIAENKVLRKKKKPKWLGWSVGIAASVAFLFPVAMFLFNHNIERGEYMAGNDADNGEVVIAYVNGKRLGPEASAKSVNDAIEQANRLMAMAIAKEREDEIKQELIMNLTSE